VSVRLINYHRRARPPSGAVGIVEPTTFLRQKNALIPHTLATAGSEGQVSIINTGEEPLLLDAGAIVGCWTPGKVISHRLSLEKD